MKGTLMAVLMAGLLVPLAGCHWHHGYGRYQYQEHYRYGSPGHGHYPYYGHHRYGPRYDD